VEGRWGITLILIASGRGRRRYEAPVHSVGVPADDGTGRNTRATLTLRTQLPNQIRIRDALLADALFGFGLCFEFVQQCVVFSAVNRQLYRLLPLAR